MNDTPHIPVLINDIISLSQPVSGVWVDGTFGNGGYSKALLAAGASNVIGIDRDPQVHEMAALWRDEYGGALRLESTTYSRMDDVAAPSSVDGVVLDIGVSSMQIDEGARGFSFQKDGPLDMRMAQTGRSAADFVNETGEDELADIFYFYGEERLSRRIARAIVARRQMQCFHSTLDLANLVSRQYPRQKPGSIHPATRVFQALRIAVNDELGELVRGLFAAEQILKEGGILAVVTFHSLEDRIVKRFFQTRAAPKVKENKYAKQQDEAQPDAYPFSLMTKKPVVASKAETAANPRARSAKLRMAKRTSGKSSPVDIYALELPQFLADRLALEMGRDAA